MMATAPCGKMFEGGDAAVRGHAENCEFCHAWQSGYIAGQLKVVNDDLRAPVPEEGTSAELCIRALVNQWREFGPEHFDETIEAAAKRFCP